ncbi:MAG: glycosyltransferase family 4 protein [Planctomycetota bacterium]
MPTPRLLWIMPQHPAPSERWMHRMLHLLPPDHLHAIAIQKSPQKPTDSVGSTPPPAPLITHDQIESHLPDITHVLVHYLPLALKLESLWQQTNAKLLAHAHGYDVTWNRVRPETNQPHHPPDYEANVRRLAQRATLIANSTPTQRALESIGVPPDRIALKPLSVTIPTTTKTHTNDHPHHPLTFLYLGRLIDFKGPDLTIQAFQRAKQLGLPPNTQLVLAGDGPLMPRCQQLASGDKNIQLLGPVDADTADQLLQHADIAVWHHQTGPVTQQVEAFGVALLEAMAHQLPIASTPSGNLPHLITPGSNGLLTPTHDLDAQAQALVQLAHDPALRQRLGNAARQHVAAHYTPDHERQALLQLLS